MSASVPLFDEQSGISVSHVFPEELSGEYEFSVAGAAVDGPISLADDTLYELTPISVSAAGDVLLPYTMPQAEYMYGCVATSLGMLLGYYDSYGYTVGNTVYDMSNLIPGTISVDSRGSDGGSIYNMSDPSLLAQFIASTGYVERFYGKSPAEELPYTYINGDPAQGLNVSAWDSLADYLGTGQYWRGNGDLSTMHYYCTLDWLNTTRQTYSVGGRTIPVKFVDFKYGLSLYVASRGYALDGALTESFEIDGNSGDFTFSDFMAEIDAGRPVLLSMDSFSGGHMVLAYGYNAATKEVIFDDTYRSNCRMNWTGTYRYSNDDFHLDGATTVVFKTDGLPVSSGGTSSSASVISGAVISAFTQVSGGTVYAGATVVSGGTLAVVSGGTANSAAVDSGGRLIVSNGGAAGSAVISGGRLIVSSGGTATDPTFTGYGFHYVYNGGTLSGAEVRSRAFLELKSGASVCDLTVASGGRAYLSGTALSGRTTVSRGGVLLTVDSNRSATLNGDLDLAGELRTTDDATAGRLNAGNHTITLDLTGRRTEELAFIDNLSRLSNFALSVAVSNTQASGVYDLAEGAAQFSGTITVCNTAGSCVSLAVGGSAALGTQSYQLTRSDGLLALNVTNSGTQKTAVIGEYTPGTWSTDWEQASAYARAHDLPIFAYYGDPTWCGFCGLMNEQLFESDDFQEFARNNLVLLYDTPVPGESYSGAPSGMLLNADGSMIAWKSGFPDGGHDIWMTWLKLQLDNAPAGIYIYSGSVLSSCGTSASGLRVVNFQSGYVISATLTDGVVGDTTGQNLPDIGLLHLKAGGVAQRTTLNSSGYLYVASGGTANSTTVHSGGLFRVLSGGTANATILMSGGHLTVSGGGTANSTTVNGGYLNVYGTADVAAVNSLGWVFVASGGTVNAAVLNAGASLYISSGGTANAAVVNSGGMLYTYREGTAISGIVNAGGRLYVNQGGLVSNAEVRGSGLLYVYGSGATAKGHVSIGSGGSFFLASSGIFSGKLTLGGGATVSAYSGTEINFDLTDRTAADTALINNLSLVRGNPDLTITVSATLADGLYALADGAANFSGTITICNTDGVCGSLSLGNGAALAGKNYALSLTDGQLKLNVGGSATPVDPGSGGSSGGSSAVDIRSITAGVASSGLVVTSGGELHVLSGGTATATSVQSGGTMFVSNGGTACGLQIAGGATVSAYNGAKFHFDLTGRTAADAALINDFSRIQGAPDFTITVSATQQVGAYKLADGAAFFNRTVTVRSTDGSSGSLSVGSSVTLAGRTYALTLNGGTLTLTAGSSSAPTPVDDNNVISSTVSITVGIVSTGLRVTAGGRLHVLSGGCIIDNTADSAGRIILSAGGTASGTIVRSGGYVSNGGMTVDTVVASSGSMGVTAGGIAGVTEVRSGGKLYISQGGYASGTLINGGYLTVSGGACATETEITAGGTMHVRTSGSASDTVVSSGGTLFISSGGVHRGSLQLADGAAVSAFADAKIDLDLAGRAPSETALLNDMSLVRGTPDWTITVAGTQEAGTYRLADGAGGFAGTITICDTNGVCGSFSVGETVTLGGQSYALNLSGAALTLTVGGTPGPGISGTAGDLNADSRADIVMTITQAGHGAYGATGAWLIQSDQTAAWGDLSQRDADWEIFGMGRTAADKTTADVYVKSTGNVIGAWTTGDDGRVSGWETVGEFSSDTEIVGLGDFNGNGQTDLLLRNANGAVGCFFTDGEGWNYFQSLGDEWKLCAIGDLNGDGRDDVVLKHDAGFAGSWLTQADGTMAWADLDTLPEGFAIVGAGDFNGDGTDDVLLQKGSYFGAWLVQDGNAAGWMGLGDLPNVTVEQIADFDGDGTDDLRVRTTSGDLGAQLVKGADALEWKYYGSVGDEWSTSLAAL